MDANKSLENLALRKELLLARSRLYRVKIHHELNAIHDAMSWARTGVTALKSLPVRSAVLGLTLLGVAHSRLARLLTLAARVLLVAKLANIAVGLWRKPSATAASLRERTDCEEHAEDLAHLTQGAPSGQKS